MFEPLTFLPHCPNGCISLDGHYVDNICTVCKFASPVKSTPKKSNRGGARPGAGQPAKHGEKTKPMRIPVSLADKIDLIVAIPELQELLDELEIECKNSTSPRYDRLKRALADIRNLGF